MPSHTSGDITKAIVDRNPYAFRVLCTGVVAEQQDRSVQMRKGESESGETCSSEDEHIEESLQVSISTPEIAAVDDALTDACEQAWQRNDMAFSCMLTLSQVGKGRSALMTTVTSAKAGSACTLIIFPLAVFCNRMIFIVFPPR